MWSSTDIDRVSDPGSIERGVRYAREGRVQHLRVTPSRISATVRGSVPYVVQLTPDDWSCDCPVGLEDWFCKHCVAVAVAARDSPAQADDDAGADDRPASDGAGADRAARPGRRQIEGAVPPEVAADRAGDEDRLRSWLEEQEAGTLVDLIESLADRHPEVLPDLLSRAARAAADPEWVKEVVRDCLVTRKSFLNWRESTQWARDAQPAVDALASLVDAGRPEAVVMIQRAVSRVVRVILKSDDSSGAAGDLARQLLDLHERACLVTPPPAKRLVAWMLKFGLDDQDFFEVDVDRYAQALGDEGVAAYRREIEQRLQSMEPGPLGIPFGLRRAQERLAIVDGDLDRLITMVGGDLDNPMCYLSVVTTLQEIDADDAAFEWAKRGLAAHGDDFGSRLSAYAVDTHLARGETEQALAIRREGLRRRPDSRRYAALRATAEAVGPGVWAAERDAALQTLRSGPSTELVTALVAEGAADEAWEASEGVSLSIQLATDLAELISATRPTEAIWLLGGAVNAELQEAGESHYRRAISLLRTMRAVAGSAQLEHVLDDFVAGVAERNKRRPTFMAKLRKAGYLD